MTSLQIWHALIFRSLFRNKIRTILTILGIALGVAVFLAIQLLNQSAVNSFESNVQQLAGQADIEITSLTTQSFDEKLLLKLRPLLQQQVEYSPVVQAKLLYEPDKQPEPVDFLGFDFIAAANHSNAISKQTTEANNYLSWFTPNAILISNTFAKTHHLKLNDRFWVQLPQSKKRLWVAGIYTPEGVYQNQNSIIADIGVAQDVLNKPGKINAIELRVNSVLRDTVKKQQIKLIQQQINKWLPNGIVATTPQDQQQKVNNLLAAFQMNLQALSNVSLLVGMFLIYNTMSISILRRRQEIGILRTLGVTRRQVFKLFLSEVFIIGLLGVLLGVLIGIVLATISLPNTSETLQQIYSLNAVQHLNIQPFAVVLAIGLGLLVNTLAALPPLIEATMVPPALVSRPHEYQGRYTKATQIIFSMGLLLLAGSACFAQTRFNTSLPVSGYISALLLMLGFACLLPLGIVVITLVLKFVLKFLQRSFRHGFWQLETASSFTIRALGKSSVSIASLMLSIALVISISTMVGSFRHTVEDWVNQTLRADVFVEPLARAYSKQVEGLPASVVKAVKANPAVAAVDDFSERRINYQGLETHLGAGNPTVLKKYGSLRFLDGRSHQAVLSKMIAGSHNALVSESFGNRYHVDTGDTVRLPSPMGALALKIVGVYYDYSSESGYIIINKPLYQQYYQDAATSSMAIYLKPGQNAMAFKRQLSEQFASTIALNIRLNSDLRQEVLHIFDRTFAITHVLLLISICISALSVAVTLFTLVLEFQADLTLLRYLGATVWDVRKIVLSQAAFFGVLGALWGMVTGYFLSWILVFVINKQSFGWTIGFDWSWSFAWMSFVVVTLGAILAALLPAVQHAKTINPEVLRRAS